MDKPRPTLKEMIHSLSFLPSSSPLLQNHRFRFRIQSMQVSQSPPERKTGVIVIGSGLADLAAATKLNSENIPFLLVEASDAVGSRVRIDIVDDFLLDRGFQIFIVGYLEAQKLLDYQSLHLQKFYSGALVYCNGHFQTVADLLRHFSDSLKTLTNPIGTLADKLLIGLTRIKVSSRSDDEILCANEVSTIDLLRKIGFYDSIIRTFFQPFFGGIFFDRELETTLRLFNFIFKCLALDDNALPSNGISGIPKQLAAILPSNSILLNSRVVSIFFDKNLPTVRLQNGDILRIELGVIVAIEEPEAHKLLVGKPVEIKKLARSTVCLYFSASQNQIPVRDPVLFLNGSGKGIVNNMFFATNVAASYGPPGKALVSVSLIGLFEGMSDKDLTAEVFRELFGWFGDVMVGSWKHLRTYRIGLAQPNQCPPTDLLKNPRIRSGIYVCGDHQTSETFDGALVSGMKAMEALLID